MTDKVNPSINRPAEAFKTAGAIALAGGADPGYVTPASSPSEISVQDGGIDETVLNAFVESHSASSFDVTIDPGEAFVYGSWCAIDTSTTVTLASSTNNQTVYVGWNKDGSNDVIIGLASAFATASGDTDKKIPLYDFDTDGSGVTAVSDRREVGQYQTLSHLEVADELGIPVYADSTNAPQNEGNVIVIDGSGSQAAGIYSHDGSSYVKTGNTDEAIQDLVNSTLAGGTGITTSYDDANNTLTISGHSRYTDEEAQDAVGTILGSLFNYDDATPAITLSIDDDELVFFGTNDDVSQRYDSTNDDMRWQDETNGTDRMALDRTTGDLSISGQLTEGATL